MKKNLGFVLIILSIAQNSLAADNINCTMTIREKNNTPQIVELAPLQQNLLSAQIGPFAASVLLNPGSQKLDLNIADEDGFIASAQAAFDTNGTATLSMSKNIVWIDLKCEKHLVY